jgi:hypothetical protein
LSRSQTRLVDKAKSILATKGNELNHKYAAEGFAVGYKIKNGKYSDTVALIFYVKKKKNTEELLAKGISPIPKKIEGVPTDVIVISKGFRSR